jgi:hypothetical protein
MSSYRTRMFAVLLASLLPATLHGRVVINEIYYHAPNDIEELAYIELHNTDEDPVDLSGWAFTRGVKFKFPDGTEIAPGGFAVICRNQARLKRFFGLNAVGVFESNLSGKGERIELTDSRGRKVDAVKYSDEAPWPLGADGLSGSLERITPEGGSDNPANWASSPLSPDRNKPTGTPGRTNSCYSAELPPVVSAVRAQPAHPRPNQPVQVEAVVRDPKGVAGVNLHYRLAGPGFEKAEVHLAMKDLGEGRYVAEIPGQAAGHLIRYRVEATGASGAQRLHPAEHEPRPAFSAFVHEPVAAAKIPFAWLINTAENEFHAAQDRLAIMARNAARGREFGGPPGPGEETKEPTSTRSAWVYFDPATNAVEVYDFVEVEPRKGGHKVHFAKGQLFRQMSTLNVMFENAGGALVEPLAYALYRQAGMAAPHSGHLRLWVNGQPAGYQLFVEQINRAFLRRNQVNDDGNLYKLLWFGDSVTEQHDKKTNERQGHDDLLDLLDQLKVKQADALWAVIRKQFDVEQVINYFAVNTLLSHWDGFFNNYFTYHDIAGTGRWTMYPWDQDQTWGLSNMGDGEQLSAMPLTFGMAGDSPQGSAGWWRPPGYFSGPLLANPMFRKLYLARTKQLLETVFSEAALGPLVAKTTDELRPEIQARAAIFKLNAAAAERRFDEQVAAIRQHIQKRRSFLLAQEEIKNAAAFSTEGLEKPTAKKKKEKAAQP